MNIRDYRELKGLSQAQFAALIRVSGAALSRYESGRVPSPKVMRRIIAVCNGAVTADDFYRHQVEAAE